VSHDPRVPNKISVLCESMHVLAMCAQLTKSNSVGVKQHVISCEFESIHTHDIAVKGQPGGQSSCFVRGLKKIGSLGVFIRSLFL
jgi:hypothetical protein